MSDMNKNLSLSHIEWVKKVVRQVGMDPGRRWDVHPGRILDFLVFNVQRLLFKSCGNSLDSHISDVKLRALCCPYFQVVDVKF